ncbi:hypothetical protein K438DRAFT_1594411 [Mycena galopus ATCC 62051]|nr:hypothetical protein K438DRAFT_1594411 [Mycena galopus ATCC 62051]
MVVVDCNTPKRPIFTLFTAERCFLDLSLRASPPQFPLLNIQRRRQDHLLPIPIGRVQFQVAATVIYTASLFKSVCLSLVLISSNLIQRLQPPRHSATQDAEHPNRALLGTHSESFSYKLPNSDSKYTARRNQLPLNPAFGFTSHNSQGRKLEAACIDLASCVSIQSAYVMLSRVKSLKGLCILRSFRLDAIKNHISGELREELARTEEKERQTLRACRKRLDWF